MQFDSRKIQLLENSSRFGFAIPVAYVNRSERDELRVLRRFVMYEVIQAFCHAGLVGIDERRHTGDAECFQLIDNRRAVQFVTHLPEAMALLGKITPDGLKYALRKIVHVHIDHGFFLPLHTGRRPVYNLAMNNNDPSLQTLTVLGLAVIFPLLCMLFMWGVKP